VTKLAATDGVVRDGLEDGFERYRVELTGYCYRMLGSVFEAEDAVQETLVRAWRGFPHFEGRSALRSWLYSIATNVCFDMLQTRGRRALPMDLRPASTGDTTSQLPEATWLQPVPDRRVLVTGPDPAEVAAARETIRLAFVAALQYLAPRQRAVLILRDVLGWQATEVAQLLDTTATAVHSTLARARATLASRGVAAGSPVPPLAETDRAMLDRYVDAFERYDIETLVSLLHEDATISMPPLPYWLHGRAAIERWWRRDGLACRVSRLVPTEANGSAALGVYRPSSTSPHEAHGIQVLEVSGGGIRAIHAFLEPALFPLFELPVRFVE
jgi:RNA polymerase sigma-70 factor, ECF subfamily